MTNRIVYENLKSTQMRNYLHEVDLSTHVLLHDGVDKRKNIGWKFRNAAAALLPLVAPLAGPGALATHWLMGAGLYQMGKVSMYCTEMSMYPAKGRFFGRSQNYMEAKKYVVDTLTGTFGNDHDEAERLKTVATGMQSDAADMLTARRIMGVAHTLGFIAVGSLGLVAGATMSPMVGIATAAAAFSALNMLSAAYSYWYEGKGTDLADNVKDLLENVPKLLEDKEEADGTEVVFMSQRSNFNHGCY